MDALEEKFMAGSGYAYFLISEHMHIYLNRNEPVSNRLLHNGLNFIVEEGVEKARTFEEV